VRGQFRFDFAIDFRALEEIGDSGKKGHVFSEKGLFVAQGFHGIDGSGAIGWEQGCEQGDS